MSSQDMLSWALFLSVAMALNLILFSLMPLLVSTSPARLDVDSIPLPVTIMHLKPPTPPAKKKPEQPPLPPVKKPPPPKPLSKNVVKQKLTLPFELNTSLPALKNSLVLPVLPPADLGMSDTIFDAGDLDSGLTILVRIPPIYPFKAKNRGVEGWVRVRFIVNEDGSVDDITVIESEPQKTFDDAVLRSVIGWRFKPGTISGIPVKTRAETIVRFNLD